MKNILLIILILNHVISHAQTGPGGVGIADGSGSLILWLNAEVGVEEAASNPAENGDNVFAWIDQSGSGNDATSPAAGAIYTTSVFNSLPVLRFSNNDGDRLISNFIRGNNENIFLVGSNRGTTNNTFVDDGNTVNSRRMFADLGASFSNPTCVISFPTFTSNPATSIANGAAFLTNYEISSTGNEEHWINGNLITSGSVPTPTAGTSLIIGNDPLLISELDGDISEIIVYNTTVNGAQRIIINNYLSAKYGFALNPNDLYVQDNSGNGDYDFDVAGIGRVDASNIHNDAQGTGIVRILNPTGLDDNEFLIWGHDNGVEQATETTDVPAGLQARFEREWRVSEVNTSSTAVDVGSIDLRFDLTGLGSVTSADLRLLVDTDNDGLFNDETPIAGATGLGSNVYEFAGVTAIANKLRFTLGTINTSQTPLPIELANFEVKLIDNRRQVELSWQTASEIDNDYFTILRSQNGINWEEINKIDGAGNSTTLLSYSVIDENPYREISYYRLKQTDFDGQFEYSQIISINIDNPKGSQIQIYPNPSENHINIIGGDESELKKLKIYNVLGQDVTDLIVIINKSDEMLTIDLSNLSNGMYWIKTKTTANKVYKQ